MQGKSRIRNLSTRFLAWYRYGFIMLMVVFIGALFYSSFEPSNWLSSITLPLIWLYIVYIWLKRNAKVFRVEFDDEFLYVIRGKQDILIPLENVKDIEMKSFGGLWKVELYYADILGDHFYFKPSLLYPFNYKTKDKLVNLLWQKIDAAKSRKQTLHPNALHS